MEDYRRKIQNYLSDYLGKGNVAVHYDANVERFDIVVRNTLGIASFSYDRENIEYDFDDTMKDILDSFILR